MSQPKRKPLCVLPPIPPYVPQHRKQEWVDDQGSYLIQVMSALERIERKLDRRTQQDRDQLRRYIGVTSAHLIAMLGFTATFVGLMIGPRIFGWPGIILIGGMAVVSALTTFVIRMVRRHLQ